MNGCTAQSQDCLPAMAAFKCAWSEPEFSSVMDLSSMLLQKRDESGPTELSATESVHGRRDTVPLRYLRENVDVLYQTFRLSLYVQIFVRLHMSEKPKRNRLLKHRSQTPDESTCLHPI